MSTNNYFDTVRSAVSLGFARATSPEEKARAMAGNEALNALVAERNFFSDRIASLEAALAAATKRADIGWNGLRTLALILGTECETKIALGMAASAAQRVVSERDSLRTQLAAEQITLNRECTAHEATRQELYAARRDFIAAREPK